MGRLKPQGPGSSPFYDRYFNTNLHLRLTQLNSQPHRQHHLPMKSSVRRAFRQEKVAWRISNYHRVDGKQSPALVKYTPSPHGGQYVMADFRERGNQLFAEKRYSLAGTYYGKAIVSVLSIYKKGIAAPSFAEPAPIKRGSLS